MSWLSDLTSLSAPTRTQPRFGSTSCTSLQLYQSLERSLTFWRIAWPKRRAGKDLKRLRNIAENPSVALVADYYNDRDWSLLGWVMLRGHAEVLHTGPEHDEAQQLLRERYPQMREMTLDEHPVIAIRIDQAVDWGDLGSV